MDSSARGGMEGNARFRSLNVGRLRLNAGKDTLNEGKDRLYAGKAGA